MLVTVTETKPTDTPKGDHLKVNRPREQRVSRTYTAHKALLDPTILRSIKDWNLPRDEEAEEVGRGVPPVAARSTAPKVVSRHERAREDNNQPAAVWLPHTPLVHAKIDGRNRVGVNGVGWPDGGGAFA